jgi:hypothetical protein
MECGRPTSRSDEMSGLEEKERQILAGGIDAILREFGADKDRGQHALVDQASLGAAIQ